MARKTLGKQRFYADVLQYLKLLGYYAGSDTPELWTLDPTNNTEYEIGEKSFGISFPNKSIDRLLTNIPQSDVSGIYAGFLGHTLANAGGFGVGLNNEESTMAAQDNTEIVNYSSYASQYNGYSLWDITSFNSQIDSINALYCSFLSDESHNIGSVSYGRWFEPEYAFDLKATVSNSYEGINTQTTVGGHSLSNIKHLGQPNWCNDLPAWTLQKQDDEDYNVGGAKGRRSWQVGFSFLSDDKLFDKAGNPDKFFTYDEDTEQHTFDTSLSSFLKLTLNGKLPFIFCPDNDADDKEFALCRITNQPKFSQVANNLWSTSLVITETW